MPADRRFPVIALAGGRLEADFRSAGYDAVNKAYLPVGGMLMLERVLRALRASQSVGSIRCVTQCDAFARAFGDRGELCDEVIEPGGDLIGSMLAGFADLDAAAPALVVATDIPLLTPNAVDAFAGRARAIDADLGYGCVTKRSHLATYPSVRHTWVRLREGTFCGAGISVIRAGAATRVASLLRDFAAARKSPLRLASLFSPWLAVRVALGRVSIGELELRANELTGLRCRGIACDEPELAVNVDRASDLREVVRIIVAREEGHERAT